MNTRRLNKTLGLGLIAIAVIAALIGLSYALPAQKTPMNLRSAGADLTLTFDRSSYSPGNIASVKVIIENTGSGTVTIENPELGPELIVYDNHMNQVGTWTEFQKALPLQPALGPIVLKTGENYSWAFNWNLGVYSTYGQAQYQELSPSSYNIQARIVFDLSGSSGESQSSAITMESGMLQFTIT